MIENPTPYRWLGYEQTDNGFERAFFVKHL
jgi:hypothetical protein